MDEALQVLENLKSSQPQIPSVYPKLSPNPPLVDEVISHNLNPISPTLSEHECHESILYQPLVEKMVDPILPLIDHTFPIESEDHIAQVLLISFYSTR